ncbi:hypothetical protein FQR65_LT17061 [Abscondita terminalis]|nr:hypothetical protein FQR65_LT17061 [Abscondita terminalis]
MNSWQTIAAVLNVDVESCEQVGNNFNIDIQLKSVRRKMNLCPELQGVANPNGHILNEKEKKEREISRYTRGACCPDTNSKAVTNTKATCCRNCNTLSCKSSSKTGGIVFEGNIPVGLLEIKCPYLGSTNTIGDVAPQLKYLFVEDEMYCLKKNHKYYAQIQLGMAILNLNNCYFTLYCSFDKSMVGMNAAERMKAKPASAIENP